MHVITKYLVFSASVAGLLSGCASVAPPQLLQARAAYVTSSNGPAALVSPTELYDARKALDLANREFEENGDTLELRDYSYIAARKVELADVKARTAIDRQNIAAATKQGIAVRDSQIKNGQQELANGREQLKDERTASGIVTGELQAANAIQGRALQNEQQARATAEAKLAGAMKDLATIAGIKEDVRGVVITLSGSVLFASNKSELLETAKTKLDQVAEALKSQGDDRSMVVEGHTDSQGSDAINQPLSLQRANSVRSYLVGRGVDADKISAVGMGSKQPLLDNHNAENRANNRRVEIVIQSKRLASR
jgi:outer membrane protein OmpA-like peptidoglycan-associated protein